jgi:hypothetical protein
MRLIYVLCAAAIAAGGCRHKSTTATSATPPAADATSRPAIPAARSSPAATTTAAISGRFDGSKWGIKLTYPAGWTPKPDKDYELFLIPTGATTDDCSLSLDIPDLPPHVPGMIPLKLVKNGYLDDLRKAHPNLQSREESPTIPGAHAVLVTSTWQSGGKRSSETALLMTHGDHVYILRANTASTPDPATRAALDSLAHSIQWGK